MKFISQCLLTTALLLSHEALSTEADDINSNGNHQGGKANSASQEPLVFNSKRADNLFNQKDDKTVAVTLNSPQGVLWSCLLEKQETNPTTSAETEKIWDMLYEDESESEKSEHEQLIKARLEIPFKQVLEEYFSEDPSKKLDQAQKVPEELNLTKEETGLATKIAQNPGIILEASDRATGQSLLTKMIPLVASIHTDMLRSYKILYLPHANLMEKMEEPENPNNLADMDLFGVLGPDILKEAAKCELILHLTQYTSLYLMSKYIWQILDKAVLLDLSIQLKKAAAEKVRNDPTINSIKERECLIQMNNTQKKK